MARVDARPSVELWRDYLFLTREMAKFLDRQDMDMFSELMEQRGRLQGIIDQTDDNGFRSSPAGRQLLNAVRQEDTNIANKLRLLYNTARHRQAAANAYDGLGFAPGGTRLNVQR